MLCSPPEYSQTKLKPPALPAAFRLQEQLLLPVQGATLIKEIGNDRIIRPAGYP
jgi:hypothetical protein